MAGTAQRNLVLILARELAENLATPLVLLDPDGRAVFFNEPAEAVLGRRFAEAASMSPGDWAKTFTRQDLDGRPLPAAGWPLSVALSERRPCRRRLRIQALDGVERTLVVDAYPLFAKVGAFVGAMALFWEAAVEGEA